MTKGSVGLVPLSGGARAELAAFQTESGRPLAAAACGRAAHLRLAGKIGNLSGFRVGSYGMLG